MFAWRYLAARKAKHAFKKFLKTRVPKIPENGNVLSFGDGSTSTH